jgi:hypothetical protein
MTPDDLMAWGCAVLFLGGMAAILVACVAGIWKNR